MSYTLYVDEVGHGSFKGINGDVDRHLSLTGVAIHREIVRHSLNPQMDTLKYSYCPLHHPDDPVILHRSQIKNKNRPFEALRDARVHAAFDNDLFAVLRDTDYVAFTVVIDKTSMQNRYTWPYPPYHYGLEVLVERYVWLLEELGATGNVMVERRTTKTDRALSDAFLLLRNNGTRFVTAARLKAVLTGQNLKIRTKQNNIAGLQLADLLANPSFKWIRAQENSSPAPPNFAGQIGQLLNQLKYYRRRGKVEGYGTKWLPK